MIELKLIVLIVCAFCKYIAEIYWHNAQRIILPVVFTLGVHALTGVWWQAAITFPLWLGYGENSPLYHSLGDSCARGMWLFLVCFFAGFGLVLTKHLFFPFIPYCLLGGIFGATTRTLNNKIISPLAGGLIASLLFFIR